MLLDEILFARICTCIFPQYAKHICILFSHNYFEFIYSLTYDIIVIVWLIIAYFIFKFYYHLFLYYLIGQRRGKSSLFSKLFNRPQYILLSNGCKPKIEEK